MSFTCSIDHDRRYLEATASGPITVEEVLAHLQEEHREHGLAYTELIDAREATPDWTSNEVRQIVALLKTLGHKSRLGPTAVVVGDNFLFGMLRMFESLPVTPA